MATKRFKDITPAIAGNLSRTSGLVGVDANEDDALITPAQIEKVLEDLDIRTLSVEGVVADLLQLGGVQTDGAVVPGQATTWWKPIPVRVVSIPNNTPTTAFTINVPNDRHAAKIRVSLTAVLGAGGAVGTHEAVAAVDYNIVVTRPAAGVNAVRAISSPVGAAGVAVPTAATITLTGTVAAVSGAAGATNTISFQVTVARSGGSSANHICIVEAEILNFNADGISIT